MAGVFLCHMSFQISIAPYRLLFKEPFGTAHGLRDGTDTVFVKLERNGVIGYGEATMPPYVNETQETVITSIRNVDLQQLEQGKLKFNGAAGPCARAGISTAYYDLISKQKTTSIGKLLDIPTSSPKRQMSLITLGITDLAGIPERLHQLPAFNGLKIKLDGKHDLEVLKIVLEQDDRSILIDANQAWTSVQHALNVIDLIGKERLLGLEQPFAVDEVDLQKELIDQSPVIVYGDESIKDMQDLEAMADRFSGVNLKLMKCGGLDDAAAMARRANELGLRVMLGSMSESSLGCGALLHLGPLADLIDLDGPWLIKNDPFTGVVLRAGEVDFADRNQGIGPVLPSWLHWTPIGA